MSAGEMGKAWRYARGLAAFWRAPYDRARSLALLKEAHEDRERRLLETIHAGIYARPQSPYLWLLRQAGIEEGDIARLVRSEGISGALAELYAAGVHVTLDEFKGNVPELRRGSQSLALTPGAFDNPLSRGHLAGSTGGSRSRGTLLHLDLADVLDELPARDVHLQAHGLSQRPFCFWRPASSLATLRMILTQSKLGIPMAGWFTPTAAGIGAVGRQSGLAFAWLTMGVSRAYGHRLLPPTYVPLSDPAPVVRWLAARTAQKQPVVLYAMANTGALLCTAALESGADIHGHHLRTTGEPLTPDKAALYERLGLTYSSAYGMTESGGLALSCGNPTAPDDMHVLDFRATLLPVPRRFPGLDGPVDTLWATVYSPSAPRLMLNVETGDYAVPSARQCGCPLGEAGLDQHLHSVRSFEKLTSAGMHFMGSALLEVLEGVLPSRYGGGPADYQFVETEEGGVTRVNLVVSPRIGPLDEPALLALVLDELERRTRGGAMQTEIWRTGQVLRVVRAEPELTRAGKILPLHVTRPSSPV